MSKPAPRKRTAAPRGREVAREPAAPGEHEIITAIRNGAYVAVARLTFLLRSDHPLPRDIREYIAGRFDKSISRQGRPIDPSRHHGQTGWRYDLSIERAKITLAETENTSAIRDLDKAIEREKLRAEYQEVRAAMWRLKREQPKDYRVRCKELKQEYPGTSPAQLAYVELANRHRSTKDAIRRALRLKPAHQN